MESRFELVLDECLRRIAEGATVEECLARHPEHASALEPHLRIAARMAHALSSVPSTQAKERARQRLYAELRDLQARDESREAKRFRIRWPAPALGGAWRVAAATAAVVLAIVFAGTGVVAASGDSIPGDALYPVKRAAESTRLAFAFSDESKALLRVSYAERRSEELARLVEAGNTALIPNVRTELGEELNAVRTTLASLQDQATVATLRNRLQESSAVQLARLQTAFTSASAEVRDEAGESLQASSAAYGDAVEVALAKAPVQLSYALPGTIQLRVTDPPPPGVEKVIVEIGQIEAHQVTTDGGQWVSLFTEAQSFDLMRVAEVQKLLGQAQVEPGTYTRLRFLIGQVTVVANGVQYSADAPSERLTLMRPFTVAEGETTFLVLDFDGERSLHSLGSGRFQLKPVVQVLAQDANVRAIQLLKEKAKVIKEKPQILDRRPATTEPGKGSIPEEEPKARLQIEGPVEAVAEDKLVVNGQPVQIPKDDVSEAEASSEIKKGQHVVVEAVERQDGSLVAVEVKQPTVEAVKERVEAAAAARPTTATEQDEGKEKREAIRVWGIVKAIEGQVWTVGERQVYVGPNATVKGTPAVGMRAAVQGLLRPDGVVEAQNVLVSTPEATPTPATKNPTPATPTSEKATKEPARKATPTPVPRRVTPTPPEPPGATATAPQRVLPTPTRPPERQQVTPRATPTPARVMPRATPSRPSERQERKQTPVATPERPGNESSSSQGDR